MDALRSGQRIVESWWQFFDYCFNHNPAALLCEPFWSKFIGAFIAIGLMLIMFGVWKYIDYQRKYNSAVIAQWEREQADESAIKEVTWHGDSAYRPDVPDDEVLQLIRAGIEQRRRDARSPTQSA